MIKKEITYVDYDGVTRTEPFYFNLNRAELLEMELAYPGGMETFLKLIVDAKDQSTIIRLIKDVLLRTQGEKTPDGRFLMKNADTRQRFEASPAYEIMFMMLASDDEKASDFLNALIPADLKEAVKKEIEARKLEEAKKASVLTTD